ncbi:conserved hypothetical protein [Flavobacterium sp. 9AF]|uniref:iron chaperone n=1 Tax=Flavobacterium sp. 9AF TaxID=2653142 RepID=UPI0012F08CAB|nr:DUF1801 domain-containing protein [Flavobacterium sp. 9AF]VXA96461.1 conserved hypothetical protein [Flavobacterium sp. 9AF]
MKNNFLSVEEYIQVFPHEIQHELEKIRKIILENAPNCIESISYGMPAYKLNKKPLVYFAAYPKHIGFYATPSGHEAFEKELSHYKQGKGSVQFPINQSIPYDLIKRMVQFRVKENESK